MVYQIKDGSNRRFWFCFSITLACVVLALEEMSWGERIFKIQSPKIFLENSDQ
jgi:hypothetical protein